MLKQQILQELNSGGRVSGQEIASRCGVSRTAVWKAINELKKDGYEIDCKNKAGYMLVRAALSGEEIAESLCSIMAESGDNARFTGVKVIYLEETESTNDYAKAISPTLDGHALIVANSQTGGKGRMGRSFYSPRGTGAYFSLVLHGERDFSAAVKVTTLTAVAVCRAIERLTPLCPTIKWVNDVIVDGKKVCGILAEAVSDVQTGKVCDVIIGIGVNVSTEDFPDDLPMAGALGKGVSRSRLIAEIVAEILKEVPFIAEKRYIEYYKRHSCVIGKEIYFIRDGVRVDAFAEGIDDDGGLIVRTADGVITLSSGEITLRVK